MHHIDAQLYSYKSYDYKYCVKNNFGQTCSPKVYSQSTLGSAPANFTYFDYEIIDTSAVLLTWTPPIYLNAPLEYFRLMRDGVEIYRGVDEWFYDQTRHIKPYNVYLYEVEVCNDLACLSNDRKLVVSTADRPAQGFRLDKLNVSHSSIQLSWKLPARPNGLTRKFVFYLREVDFELEMRHSFQARSDLIRASVRTNASFQPVYFSSELIQQPQTSVFNLLLENLRPNTKYNVRLLACNADSCSLANDAQLIPLITDDYHLSGFRDPAVYVLDHQTVDIVWQEPRQKNGFLTSFKLYRNNVFLIGFDMTSPSVDARLRQTLDFYSFVDANLQPNTFYSYRVEATNVHFSLSTNDAVVQTPPGKFFSPCGNKTDLNQSSSIHSSIISLLDMVDLNFTVNESTKIVLKYEYERWKQFIACVSKSSYGHEELLKQAVAGLNVTTAVDKSVFIIKILLQSSTDGLQALDFPYPSAVGQQAPYVESVIGGLLPYNNYSVRISFSTVFPALQILTTDAIYLQTFEQAPCCVLDPPVLVKHNQSKSFSVRWRKPAYPNGLMSKFRVIRAKLTGNGCVDYSRRSSFMKNEIETLVEFILDLDVENFLYDETNDEYVYRDEDDELWTRLSFYAYRVIAYNDKGSLTSEWSRATLSFEQYLMPQAPFDLRVIDAHESGFRIKYKEPKQFGGYLSHYLLKLLPINSNDQSFQPRDYFRLIIVSNRTCKAENAPESFGEFTVNGLESFKSYRVTLSSVNRAGVMSNESEVIIANTLKSSPKHLSTLLADPVEKPTGNESSVMRKFMYFYLFSQFKILKQPKTKKKQESYLKIKLKIFKSH